METAAQDRGGLWWRHD